MSAPLPDDLPRLLAEDACAVFWWAFRMRMPRAQQIEEVEKALAKRLTDYPHPLLQGQTAGCLVDQAPLRTAQNDEGSPSLVGEGGCKAGHCSVKAEQQDAANQWVGNEPEVGGTDTATNSQIEPGVADPAKAGAWLGLARAL